MNGPASYDARIELLRAFRAAILRWFDARYEPEGKDELRSFINRNIKAAQMAARDAGCLGTVTIGPPPAIGGLVVEHADPFLSVFHDFWGRSLIPTAADMCDQAIGVYEHLSKGTGLISLPRREVVDVGSSTRRLLSPPFETGSAQR